MPLAELADGERLCCDTGSFGWGFPSSLSPKASGLALSVALSRVSQPVYNIEVHGEHVYQVGELGLVVHNVKSSILNQGYSLRLKSSRASVFSANRKVYNEFLENGSKLIVKRDLIKFGDDGAQILGEFNSVNCVLVRDSPRVRTRFSRAISPLVPGSCRSQAKRTPVP